MRLIKLHEYSDEDKIYINPLKVEAVTCNYKFDYGLKKDVPDGTKIGFSDYDSTVCVKEPVDDVVKKINDEFSKLVINNVGTLTIN